MSGRLADRVALVTGAGRGIGAAIARAFDAEGASVAVGYRTSESAAHALVVELGDGLSVQLDVTDRKSVRAALDRVLVHWGRLDVLVNNAGFLVQEPFAGITDESWRHSIEVNLNGVFTCTQEATPALVHTRGCVINVSSVGGQLGGPKAPHYSAAKAAVLAFTKSTARLLAPDGVRVNAIAPGFIRTDMYDHVLESAAEEAILLGIPLGRVGEPEDVAAAAVYLASDDASFVTGHVLDVNGGQSMR